MHSFTFGEPYEKYVVHHNGDYSGECDVSIRIGSDEFHLGGRSAPYLTAEFDYDVLYTNALKGWDLVLECQDVDGLRDVPVQDRTVPTWFLRGFIAEAISREIVGELELALYADIFAEYVLLADPEHRRYGRDGKPMPPELRALEVPDTKEYPTAQAEGVPQQEHLTPAGTTPDREDSLSNGTDHIRAWLVGNDTILTEATDLSGPDYWAHSSHGRWPVAADAVPAGARPMVVLPEVQVHRNNLSVFVDQDEATVFDGSLVELNEVIEDAQYNLALLLKARELFEQTQEQELAEARRLIREELGAGVYRLKEHEGLPTRIAVVSDQGDLIVLPGIAGLQDWTILYPRAVGWIFTQYFVGDLADVSRSGIVFTKNSGRS